MICFFLWCELGCCCPFSFSIYFYFTLQIHLIWFVFACHSLIWLLHILIVYYKACEYISYSYIIFFCLFCYISFVLLASPFFAIFVRLSVWDSDSELKTEKGFSHGLRMPNEAFFHYNPELLGLGRQFGQINFGAFGVFSAELSAPILVQCSESLVHVFHYSTIISTKN